MRLHGLNNRAARDSECHIVGITRVRHDNLVARIEASHESEQNSLTTACCNDNLVRREVDSVLGIVAHHLRSQGLCALRRRIVQNRPIHIPHSIERTRRRQDIRLTDIEVIDVYSVTLGSIGILSQFSNRRLRHVLRTN